MNICRNGIIFDIFQCVIQRCFNYPTADTRDCYAILRELLYNQYITSVVLILHSQGGIAGSMVLDRLHAEIREDLFAKLEVYTFGNAANHFNNPYCSLRGHVGPSLATLSLDPDPEAQLAGMELITGKAIRHIEHYANTSDPLARLGVLNDPVGVLSNTISAKNRTNFTGSIFERGEIGGQLFCHDYLDKMFPLKRCAEGAGIGGSGFVGALEEENEFMEATLGRIEEVAGRESWEMSYFGVHGELLEAPTEGKYTASNIGLNFLAWEWQSNVEEVSKSSIERAGISLSGAPPGRVFDFKVKDLSRLWLYVNGKNPKKTLVDLRNAKMSEI
jgi:hypothetical protein